MWFLLPNTGQTETEEISPVGLDAAGACAGAPAGVHKGYALDPDPPTRRTPG